MARMDQQRSVVLPFPTQKSRDRRRKRSAATKSARRGVGQTDVDANAEWDVLLTRAVQAWCWRDPDSIRVVEQCLARLKVSVDADWS
jgi:hypothetical protein